MVQNKFLRNFQTKDTSYLLQKIDQTGTVKRRKGSGRKRTVLIDDNIHAVNELVLSQEEHQQNKRRG